MPSPLEQYIASTSAPKEEEVRKSRGFVQRTSDISNQLDEWLAGMALSIADPDKKAYLELKKSVGLPVKASDYYKAIRESTGKKFKPTALDRILGIAAMMGEAPGALAGMHVGRTVGGLAGPLGALAGSGVGLAAGWLGARHIASMADPGLAGRNIALDLALGTAGRFGGRRVLGAVRKGAGKLKPVRKGTQVVVAKNIPTGTQLELHLPVQPQQGVLPGMDEATINRIRDLGAILKRGTRAKVSSPVQLDLPGISGPVQMSLPGLSPSATKAAAKKSVQQMIIELPPEAEEIPTILSLGEGIMPKPILDQESKRRAAFNWLDLGGLSRAESNYLASKRYSPQSQAVVKKVRKTNKKRGIETFKFR